MNKQIATTIQSQILTSTKMSVGYRKAAIIENGLQFNILTGNSKMIQVTLNANDLYDIKRIHVRKLTPKTVEESTNVHVEELNEVIYHMVNK